MQTWHAMSTDEAFARIGSSARGLDDADAAARLARAGPNAIPGVPPTAAWIVFLTQFRSVIVVLLIAAAMVALWTGDRGDALAIGAVLAINVGLGFVVEMRARRAVEALGRLEARRATVLRRGQPCEIDARQVVPGDVLLVEAGQSIAADARLFSVHELRMVESALTGESAPVSKSVDPLDGATPLPERRNIVYAGTTAAAGSARGVVVATGTATELGAIGQLVRSTQEEKSPLERRLDALGRQLVVVAIAVGIVMFALGALQGSPTGPLLQAAIALAVAAVPEGLPAVSTIALALGVRRMARRRALVRRLHSVESLGAVTVICTDKTGTLTGGQMMVTEIWTGDAEIRVTGDGYAPTGEFRTAGARVEPAGHARLQTILQIGMLANRADAVLTGHGWEARGDPTEAALIVAGRKAGLERQALLEQSPEVGEVPFSSERKLMATFNRLDSSVVAHVKGAPQRVLELCVLTDQERAATLARNRDMAARGLRVLAFASGRVAHREESALTDLTFAGLVGIMDPPAAGVAETVQRFKAAGINTVMVTGDQRLTAEAVARDLGLLDPATGATLDGREVDGLGDGELETRLARAKVLSRIGPEAKLRIVAAYQRRGQVVAMLGDGVNDAAALKRADVGVTMGGRGTDVARETADVVLEDDRFSTIGIAIEEGRVIFDNIRKFIFYLFSCNLAEIVVLFGTTAAGLPLPMEPIQILWLNLVTDTLPALALAMEPPEPDVMRRSPHDPRAGILSSRAIGSVLLYASLIAAATFLVMVVHRGAEPARAMTLTFTTLALAQVFHLGNARSRGPVVSPQRIIANLPAVAAVAIVILLQVAAVHVEPLARVLHAVPLSAYEWVTVIAFAAIPGVVGQALKLAR